MQSNGGVLDEGVLRGGAHRCVFTFGAGVDREVVAVRGGAVFF